MKAILEGDDLVYRTGCVHDLGERLSFALTNPAFVRDQGTKMIERVGRSHDWERIYEKYRNVVEDLIKAP